MTDEELKKYEERANAGVGQSWVLSLVSEIRTLNEEVAYLKHQLLSVQGNCTCDACWPLLSIPVTPKHKVAEIDRVRKALKKR